MDDLISRQAAIDAVEFGITYAKAIDANTGEVRYLFQEENDALKKAIERLKALPHAQPKTAKWIKTGYRWLKCSNCCWEDIDMRLAHTDYCPGCGARMEE